MPHGRGVTLVPSSGKGSTFSPGSDTYIASGVERNVSLFATERSATGIAFQVRQENIALIELFPNGTDVERLKDIRSIG